MMVSVCTMATGSDDLLLMKGDYNNCSVAHVSGDVALLTKEKVMQNEPWGRMISNASTACGDSFNDSQSECGSISSTSQDDESDEDALDRIFAFDEELVDLDRKAEITDSSSIVFEDIFFLEK